MRAVKASLATPYQEKIEVDVRSWGINEAAHTLTLLPCSRESVLLTYDAASSGLKL
jgi:hypothetical protein